MIAKDARLDIKTTRSAKATLEQAANIMGTTVSAFLIDAAMQKAYKIISQLQVIDLNNQEAERFVKVLDSPPEANTPLKELFNKHKKK